MKKTIFGCLGAAAVAFTLQFTPVNANAGLFNDCAPCDEIAECDPCDPCGFDSCDPCDAVCGPKAGKWFVEGFIEAGFWANQYGHTNDYYGNNFGQPDGRHNSWLVPGNTQALQNVQHTGFQANQVYFSVGRRTNGKHGWDFGGQADFVFGSDAWMVQSQGLEVGTDHDQFGWGTGDYYSAFAQAYLEAAYKKTTIKLGKIFAPFGAQGFRGDQNFFYSFAPNYVITPNTITGMLFEYKVNNRLMVFAGGGAPNEFVEDSHNNAILAGLNFQATKRLNLSYAVAFGTIDRERFATAGGFGPLVVDQDYFVQSLVATYNLNKKWKAVFDWSLGTNSTEGPGAVETDNANWGVNAALYYQYTKNLAFGVRYNYSAVAGDMNVQWGTPNHRDWTAVSFGANWTPTKWLVVKPEARWDVIHDGFGGYFVDGKKDLPTTSQFSGGVSTVVKF